MADAFKNVFNAELIAMMARHFKRVWAGFDELAFIDHAGRDLDSLELKQRSDQITQAMVETLPQHFTEAATVVIASLHPKDDIDLSDMGSDDRGLRGWATMPMTEYVGRHGIADFDLGMTVQKEITKRGSSEFGIRRFIIANQDRALATLADWAGDQNYHVRRLVSEGSRPRLPWAIRLPSLIDDPSPLFPILERLKDDDEEYVRRSVANNLNDIAKDHADKIAEIAAAWSTDANPARHKLIRHACRSLVKQGHKPTLAALGYKAPEVNLARFNILTPKVAFGDKLQFEIALRSTANNSQNLIVDYVIHHMKANGKQSPKVFKWKTLKLKRNECHQASRNHAIKPITTRKYYPGAHKVVIQINGETLGSASFELMME